MATPGSTLGAFSCKLWGKLLMAGNDAILSADSYQRAPSRTRPPATPRKMVGQRGEIYVGIKRRKPSTRSSEGFLRLGLIPPLSPV